MNDLEDTATVLNATPYARSADDKSEGRIEKESIHGSQSEKRGDSTELPAGVQPAEEEESRYVTGKKLAIIFTFVPAPIFPP